MYKDHYGQIEMWYFMSCALFKSLPDFGDNKSAQFTIPQTVTDINEPS